jgi:hypothetical protein
MQTGDNARIVTQHVAAAMLSEMVESTPAASYRFRRKWNPDNAKPGGKCQP